MERAYQRITDLGLMLELAHRNPAEACHLIDLPYRLNAWALRRPENTHLWFDESGILRAWVLLNFPSWAIDYVFDPITDRSLHCQILDWTLERVRSILDRQEYPDNHRYADRTKPDGWNYSRDAGIHGDDWSRDRCGLFLCPEYAHSLCRSAVSYAADPVA